MCHVLLYSGKLKGTLTGPDKQEKYFLSHELKGLFTTMSHVF